MQPESLTVDSYIRSRTTRYADYDTPTTSSKVEDIINSLKDISGSNNRTRSKDQVAIQSLVQSNQVSNHCTL